MKWALLLLLSFSITFAHFDGKSAHPTYQKPFKVLFHIFLDKPEKFRPALGWISNVFQVLTNPPYEFSPEDIKIVVVSQGREIPFFTLKSRMEHPDVYERLESLSLYGVKFKVCRIAAEQLYGLSDRDFYPFVELVPSAIVEIAHWQQEGYALVIPMLFDRER